VAHLVAGVVLQQSSGVGGCLLPPPFLLFLLLFASSPPFSSLSFLCKLKCVNERERERVLVAWRCFVRG